MHQDLEVWIRMQREIRLDLGFSYIHFSPRKYISYSDVSGL